MPRFGQELVFGESNPVISSIIDDLGRRGLESIESKIVMLDRYESTFGIFDHGRFSNTRPLALVAMHAKEDTSSYSKLYRSIYRYHQYQIYQKTGLDLNRFFELPHDIVELLFKISAETAEVDNKPIEDALKHLAKNEH